MSSWLLGVNDDDKWCIEDANSCRTIVDDIEQKRDARLIATAPEMYDELYEILQFMKGSTSYEGDEYSRFARDIEKLFAWINGEEAHA